MYKQKTIYKASAIDPDLATGLYISLKDDIEWEDGVRSRRGFTRKAKAINIQDYPDISNIISDTLKKVSSIKWGILGVYLNYYQNGEMYTPNHRHQGTSQLVISLGATRTLTLGKRSFKMRSGDAILFGSSVHGVPKEPNVIDGRISIATFMVPLARTG